ncbi:MAG: sel1 repeat family protein [Treponema sp.]|nr:sel1 repeat family protein [Treponema sp.]
MKKLFFVAIAAFGMTLCFAESKVTTNIGAENGTNGNDVHYEYKITFDDLKGLLSDNPAKNGDSANKDELHLDKFAKDKAPESTEPDIGKIRPLAEGGNANFQTVLGRAYAHGEGVEQSWEEAVRWYTLAAEQGDKRAQNNLGCCYLDGKGVEKNYENARYWFDKSVAQNFPLAMLNIGEMYKDGLGVTQDYKTAMNWYKKAEKLDSRESYYCIGILYKDGLGVSQSDKKARSYLKKSADRGFAPAKEALGELNKKK